jgi:disulfide bond formation protein DsbB
MDTATVSRFLATLALACWAGLAAGGVVWLMAGRSDAAAQMQADIRRWALALAFLIAATAMAGSLYYSEVADFVPCRLCWFQRIGMYPLAVILGVAALRRDPDVRWYALPLAGIGAVIAAYHSWLQAFPPSSGSSFCTLDAPCTTRHVWEFGFVSIPFMAFTGFVTIGALLLVAGSRPSPSETETAP